MTTPTPVLRPPNGVTLTLHLLHEGQQAAVVLGGTTQAADMTQQLASAWLTAAWQRLVRPCVINTVQCIGATVRDVSVENGDLWTLSSPPTPTGAFNDSNGVAAAAVLIKWSTIHPGRSGKGRSFLPGLASEMVDSTGRGYVPAMRTAVQTAIDDYLGDPTFGNDALRPAVISYRTGQARIIINGTLAPTIGLQRRRMR